MKVLLVNGSPREKGNTFVALSEIEKTLAAEGITSEIFNIGNQPVRGCINCQQCKFTGNCVFTDDILPEMAEKLVAADGLVIGSPVYFAGPNGALLALLDRLFYSKMSQLAGKAAASVAVCRRAGTTATIDRLNKYFLMTNMFVVGSQYWNIIHGAKPGEAAEDPEGLQTMRTLARNMAYFLKATDGKPMPEYEKKERTNFIR